MTWDMRFMEIGLRRPGLLAAVAALCLACAQPAWARAYRIGILNDAWAPNHPTVEGLKTGLRHLGLVEGRDVTFEIRFTEGKREGLPAAAQALVANGADLIFTSNEAATLAARNASSTTPIVFTLVGDPVASGILDSLARPGRNITGVHDASARLTAKRVELLRLLQPDLRRVWFLHRSGDPVDSAALAAAQAAARSLKLQLVSRPFVNSDQIPALLKDARKGDALLAPHEADACAQILQASARQRIPAIFPAGQWVASGGLVSYGPSLYGTGQQAARVVTKVLHGALPADLPVETADDFELEINLGTARLLGVTVPRELLFRANVFRQ